MRVLELIERNVRRMKSIAKGSRKEWWEKERCGTNGRGIVEFLDEGVKARTQGHVDDDEVEFEIGGIV